MHVLWCVGKNEKVDIFSVKAVSRYLCLKPTSRETVRDYSRKNLQTNLFKIDLPKRFYITSDFAPWHIQATMLCKKFSFLYFSYRKSLLCFWINECCFAFLRHVSELRGGQSCVAILTLEWYRWFCPFGCWWHRWSQLYKWQLFLHYGFSSHRATGLGSRSWTYA